MDVHTSDTENKDQMKVSIIIPAYNEQNRIGKTLDAYNDFLKTKNCIFELVVVLNGCTDNTYHVVHAKQSAIPHLIIIDIPQAGKGLAIKAGFADALSRSNDLIAFIDADMATRPEQFYELLERIEEHDGIIASRYMKGAQVFPPRPGIKEWGRRLVYQPLVRLLFGMRFADYQCGAKVFKRKVIEKVAPHFSVRQWAFDVELLYVCKRGGFTITECPTVWYDQADSKLKIRSGFRMLGALVKVRFKHSFLYQKFFA